MTQTLLSVLSLILAAMAGLWATRSTRTDKYYGALSARVDKLEAERDQFRDRYYQLREDYVELKAKFSNATEEIIDLRGRLRKAGIE